MSRANQELVFGAALSNEYQWRNLYLKEFGCCTYAPPMPKDPITTAEGVYPLRRQVNQLTQTFSDSDSDNFSDGDDERGTSLSFLTPHLHGREVSLTSGANPGASTTSRGRSGVSDQFFLLDLSMHTNSVLQANASTTANNNNNSGNKRVSGAAGGARRGNRGAALRKDDFFDTNDAFSTKFFSFLWRQDNDDDDDDGADRDGGERDEDAANRAAALNDPFGIVASANHSVNDTLHSPFGSPGPQRRGVLPQAHMLDGIVRDSQGSSRRLTFSKNGLFTSTSRGEVSDNPHNLHDAMLRLHHETWVMLMDNRLLAWLHRQTSDHYQSATQLRQRLLDVVARGPASLKSANGAATAGDAGSQRMAALAPTRTQEEALQGTFESFSPFFVVIAPPPAVQRAKDQFQAARRAQLRNGSRVAKTAPADIVGLPLYSQYGSWREAYEHRQRWSKAPFSFFLLHDYSYNYAQVAAIFVELHLLYLHAHTHTTLCAEIKRESVPLQDGSQQLITARTINRAVEYQRSLCPFTAMQEVAENIILAYEQSSSRTTLTMLRRVLDFLTDAALDVVTAHRFVSRDALLRQNGFDLPGVEVKSTRGPQPATAGANGGAAEKKTGPLSDGDDDRSPNNHHNNMSSSDATTTTTAATTAEPAAAEAEREKSPKKDGEKLRSPLGPAAIPVAFFEPQRVTEKNVNELFEVAYWFTDAATANAHVPVDPSLLRAAPELDQMSSNNGGVGGGGSPDDDGVVPPLPLPPLLPEMLDLPPQPGQYLPGKHLAYNPVESFVQAAEMLEAHRKPLWMQQQQQQAQAGRAGASPTSKKAPSVAFQQDNPHHAATANTAAVSPLLSADSFTGLATPLVLLTTYLRLHGGQWLKQLCSRVFDILRKQSVMLYVNTLDIDVAWAAMRRGSASQAASPVKAGTAASATSRKSMTPAMRRRGRGPTETAPTAATLSSTAATAAAAASATATSPRSPSATDMLTDGDMTRQSFIANLGKFEAIVAQDIRYAITQFFEALHGRRSTGRLPHGISVLLTQFVTTVHLFLLDSSSAGGAGGMGAPNNNNNNTHNNNSAFGPGEATSGGANGAGAGNDSFNNGGRRSMGRQGSHVSAGGGGRPGVDSTPVQQVEERLQACKQRYLAGLRRRQVDSAEALLRSPFLASSAAAAAAARGSTGSRRSRGKSPSQSDRTTSTAANAPSLSRLFQTIEQHRLAKFILFDCWILPALSNAVTLGYLAPDSPLHLRWNVDALARYLKVLLHAPFAEQDKTTFASLVAQRAQNAQNRHADALSGGGKHRSTSRSPRQKSINSSDSRGHPQHIGVLTLPPYLTGIYDVATGSLVRLHATSARAVPTSPPQQQLPAVDVSVADSPSRSAAPTRTAKSKSKSEMLSAVVSNVSGDRPSLALSGVDDSASSGMGSQLVSWDRHKNSLFESFPSSAAAESTVMDAASSPLDAPALVSPKALAQRRPPMQSISGSTVPPRFGSAATFAPLDRNFLPPVSSQQQQQPQSQHSVVGAESRPSTGLRSTSVVGASQPSVQPPGLRGLRGLSGTLTGTVVDSRASSALSRPAPPTAPSKTSATASAVDAITANSLHPYVFVNEAGWLDMSPAMQLLNEQIGLTSYDADAEELPSGGLAFPFLSAAGGGSGGGRGRASQMPATSSAAAAAMTTGLRMPSMDDGSFASSTTQRELMEELSPVQALNAFCKAAAADESDNVVVSEFDVLPSMAAGCIEKVYDVVTGAHPMVARALQTGAFNFTRQSGLASARSSPAAGGGGSGGSGPTTTTATADFSSLYLACLNGVLLHPRIAARVMQNIFENGPAFGQTLMKPVVDGTALELLSNLVARHGDTPMVDANAIVPLLQMTIKPAGEPFNGNVRLPSNAVVVRRNTGSSIATTALTPATSAMAAAAAPAAAAITTMNNALVRRWESESRRLLRHFHFLTTGYADALQPLPLVPGIRRPVGPEHPIHMVRAGAARIVAEGGASIIPVVFDPWWRAMVVALTVKAFNMFDECRDEHSTAFLKMVHEREEAAKLVNRQATAYFVSTKGKETSETVEPAGAGKTTITLGGRRSRTGASAATASGGGGGGGRRSRDPRKHKSSLPSHTQGSSSLMRKKPATSKRSSRANAASPVFSAGTT